MKSTHPIDGIIRIAQPGEKPKSREQQLQLDRKGKVATGLLATLMAGRYIVRADSEIEIVGATTSIKDFDRGRVEVLPYRCRVKLMPAQLNTAVEALWEDGKLPSVVLEQRINEAIQHWWDTTELRKAAPLERVVRQEKERIADAIKVHFRDIGIGIRLVFEVDDVPVGSGPRVLKPFSFPVRVQGYPDRELPFEIELQLIGNDAVVNLDQKLLVTDAEWQAVIRAACQAAAQNSISLGQYYHDRVLVEREIRAGIDHAINRYGRKCGWIFITTQPAPEQKIYRDIEFVWRAPYGREVKFIVRIETIISPNDEPVYARAGSPELTAWLKRNLEEAVTQHLLKLDSTYLRPDTSAALQDALELELRARSKRIGVTIRTLVITSRLPEWRYLERFTCLIPPRSYETTDPGVPVEFDMAVTGRFKDLGAVKHLVWPEDRLEKEIEDGAVEAARQVVRGIGPLDYLTRFHQPVDLSGEKAPTATKLQISLQEQIVKAVTNNVRRRLGMDVQEVFVRRVDQGWRDIVDEFERAKDRNFSTTARPFDRDHDFHQFPIHMTLRLSAVQPELFILLYKKKILPADIWQQAEKWVQERLDRLSVKAYRPHQVELLADDEVRRALDDTVSQNALKYYSLKMEITYLKVGETEADSIHRGQRGKPIRTMKAHLEVEIARLEHEKNKLLADFQHADTMDGLRHEGNVELIKTITKKKLEAIERMASADFDEAMDVLEAREGKLLPPSSQQFALLQTPIDESGELPSSPGSDGAKATERDPVAEKSEKHRDF